jgi:hypothetical protein
MDKLAWLISLIPNQQTLDSIYFKNSLSKSWLIDAEQDHRDNTSEVHACQAR